MSVLAAARMAEAGLVDNIKKNLENVKGTLEAIKTIE
jgi:hypothetical protein